MVLATLKKKRNIKSNVALVPVCKKKYKERKKKVLGQDTESELVGFLKFRISGIFKVALLSFRSSQVT